MPELSELAESVRRRQEVLRAFLFASGKTKKNNEPIMTATRMQKEIFLLQMETLYQREKLYEFVPPYYGPFSRDLAVDLGTLTDDGSTIEDVEGIRLSPAGYNKASRIWNSLDEKHQKALITVKEKYNRLDTSDLLEYVYNEYPKFRTMSALREDVVNAYFDEFWERKGLSTEYIVNAVRALRSSRNESGC